MRKFYNDYGRQAAMSFDPDYAPQIDDSLPAPLPVEKPLRALMVTDSENVLEFNAIGVDFRHPIMLKLLTRMGWWWESREMQMDILQRADAAARNGRSYELYF